MPTPINFNELENRMLQSQFRSIYENDCVRSLEGPLILGILNKFETWPAEVTFTEQEDRRVQVEMEQYIEIMKPYPYPYSPLTFGQPTEQMQICYGVLQKLKQAH